MHTILTFRMLAFERHDGWRMICLDTDIAVAAVTWDELESKMRDAMRLYLLSFTYEELQQRVYVRLAPVSYRVRWWFRWNVVRLMHLLSGPIRATYDIDTSRLSFA